MRLLHIRSYIEMMIDKLTSTIGMHIMLVALLIALLVYIAIEIKRSSEAREREMNDLRITLTKRIASVEKRQDYLEREVTKEIIDKLEEARAERDAQIRGLSEQIFQLASRGNV